MIAVSGVLSGQGYVTPGLVPLPSGSYSRGYSAFSNDFSLSFFKPRAGAADIDVDGNVYLLGYEFHSGSTGKNDWMIGLSYIAGDIDIEPSKASFSNVFGVSGEWYFDKGMSVYGQSRFGDYSENGPEYSMNDNTIGLRFKVEGTPGEGAMQQSGRAGVFYNFGEFDSAGGTVSFSGTEIVGFEVENVSWLKWYYGEVDGRKLITTDAAFPFYEDQEYGMAYCIRYVMVNSHTDSLGTPHLLGYGSRLQDWTEHEEWWLQVSFGAGDSSSDWSGYIGYGIYRAPAIAGQNDSALMALSLSYHY